MLNHLSPSSIGYPTLDEHRPFATYLTHCRSLIKSRRTDLNSSDAEANKIIDANSPFEYYPTPLVNNGQRLKYGALLLHGLFDSPFSLRDIAARLQTHGILCRAILLPGHGTRPSDLLQVSYEDWVHVVRYGLNTLLHEVDRVFLIGYSTGGTLAIDQALQEPALAGLILLAPAIRISVPIEIIMHWRRLIAWIMRHKLWMYHEEEIDYIRYQSIPFNPIFQLSTLIDKTTQSLRKRPLTCPLFMVLSHDDEIVSSRAATHFFHQHIHPDSRLLLYRASDQAVSDPRIIERSAAYPALNIENFSHMTLPFAPDNTHYGQHGDYRYASFDPADHCLYGAYNRIEEKYYRQLYTLKLIQDQRRALSYNPDFDFMAEKIIEFIVTH